MDYQLEIKQIVDYPRCRIYREFIRTLMEDRNIRTNGSSYLFYYMTLCSYANFRSSYRRLEGISYLVGPGNGSVRLQSLQNGSAQSSSTRLSPYWTIFRSSTTSPTPDWAGAISSNSQSTTGNSITRHLTTITHV